MTPSRRRSRSGVCSYRILGPQVPAEGAYMAQSKKRKDKGAGGVRMLPVLHPDAAGIDVGAEEVFVAVPPDRAAEPVRSFDTFTRDLNEMADWLQSCGIRSVAMESTGVYWIPLFQIVETRGFEVFLANAQHEKCAWLQERRLRLPVDPVSACGGAAESELPTA